MNLTLSNKGEIKCVQGRPTDQFIYKSPLTINQRIILSISVIVLVLFSIFGNVATLVVAVKSRQIRPFFRTCLISMALSDLICSVLSGMNYVSRYMTSFSFFWTLGSLMCRLMPFTITLSVLVNGITLVGISLDRYLSIENIIKSTWEPDWKRCILLTAITWVISAAIASPAIPAYKYTEVYTFVLDDFNKTSITSVIANHMCAANKTDNAVYYTVLVAFLFLPTFVAFLWFNSVLACEIWQRYKNVTSTPTPLSNATSQQVVSNTTKKLSAVEAQHSSKDIYCKDQTGSNNFTIKVSECPTTRLSKESRQLRMFCVILLLMFMYLSLRLPEWIFLLLSFYNAYRLSNVDAFLLQSSFGILSLSTTAFNPILYAFVTQTVQYLIDLYKKTRNILKICCLRAGFALSSVLEQQVEKSQSSPSD